MADKNWIVVQLHNIQGKLSLKRHVLVFIWHAEGRVDLVKCFLHSHIVMQRSEVTLIGLVISLIRILNVKLRLWDILIICVLEMNMFSFRPEHSVLIESIIVLS